jgi:anthranilate phosphoribosyltransferase
MVTYHVRARTGEIAYAGTDVERARQVLRSVPNSVLVALVVADAGYRVCPHCGEGHPGTECES